MEGVVDAVMREVLTEIGGPDLCVTEFLRVTNLLLPKKEFLKIGPELNSQSKTKSGTPVVFQLLGGQPGPLAENARRAYEMGAFGIDLNFGCPAKTVNRHDGGASLLQFPDRIFKIVEEVRKSVPAKCPVSVKMRLGFHDKALYLDNSLAAQSAGASWLTVHARTRDEGYKPPAHWNYLAELKQILKIPLVANGEINSVNDFIKIKKETQCEHFMIGRAAIRNPFLFLQIKQHLNLSTPCSLQKEPYSLLHLMREFYQRSEAFKSSNFAVDRTKQWLRYMSQDINDAKVLFDQVKTIHNSEEFEKRLFL
jgi:tRNA-dihydrouridine synthase C